MTEGSTEVRTPSPEAQIATELARVQEDSYGVGTHGVDVTIGKDSVVAILDIELATSEQTLIDAGRGDSVKAVRDSFQHAIEPSFRAIVERATGRRVISFLSSTSIEPLYAVEVFRLEPQEGTGS